MTGREPGPRDGDARGRDGDRGPGSGDAGGPRLVATVPDRRRAARSWVLGLAASWLGLAIDEVPGDPRSRHTELRVAGADDDRVVALPEVLFAVSDEAWLTPAAAPLAPLRRVRPPAPAGDARSAPAPAGDLPVLFGAASDDGRPWRVDGPRTELAVDVLGGMFWLLARCEEVIAATRDAHGRFPLAASLAAAEGFLDRPLADSYADLLAAAVRATWPELPGPPEAPPFRLRLTHDIDTPFGAWGRPARVVARALAGDLTRRRDPRLAAARARAVLDARRGRVDRDPLATFDGLMDVAEANGLHAQFYFLAGTDPSGVDLRYRVADPPFAPILRRVHDRGHAIGLHAGYGSFRDPAVMAGELAGLRDACRAAGVERATWGVRQHFLRWVWPETARLHEATGFDHDSTIGFAESIGFRAGTSRSYRLFDPVAGRPMALEERPLIVMDTTLLEYMGLDRDAAADRTRRLIDRCRRPGGEAVLLVHNDRVAGRAPMAWYRELVAGLARP